MRHEHSFPRTLLLPLVRTLLLYMLTVTTQVAIFAQVDRAALEGTVTDPTGAAIVGANVKALAVDTGVTQKRQTNSSGYYRFLGLAVGRYIVTVTAGGFSIKVVQEVVIQVGQTRTLDVELSVGTVTERIEVGASNAPSERSSADASTVISSAQIANLPNNGRD